LAGKVFGWFSLKNVSNWSKFHPRCPPLLKKKMVKLAKLALFEAMDIIVKDVYKL
jgi:hypothetical protein